VDPALFLFSPPQGVRPAHQRGQPLHALPGPVSARFRRPGPPRFKADEPSIRASTG